jgi:hypothetical protein
MYCKKRYFSVKESAFDGVSIMVRGPGLSRHTLGDLGEEDAVG